MELSELHDRLTGERLYLNTAERARFLEATRYQEPNVKYFCQMLYYTGCRLNEALTVRYDRFDLSEKGVFIETLKRRRPGVFRFIDLPDDFLEKLNDVYHIRKIQAIPGRKDEKLWMFTDRTGQNYVKTVMLQADISGKKASPKGLRHAFGIAATEQKVPPHQLQEWLGHRFIESTAVYTRAQGKERRELAKRLWELTVPDKSAHQI